MIRLTTLPAPTSPADPPAAILAHDGLRPDGLTKELVARAAALNLVKGAGDAAALVQLHDLLDPAVAAATASRAGVVNPVVARIVSLDALNVPPDMTASDATAALAGAVYDVSLNRPLTVPAKAMPPVPACGPTAAPVDLTGLDLLGPEFEPLRLVLTRTLMAVRPDLYAAYRRAKDAAAPDARERAYGYAFGLLATLTHQTFGPGGTGGV